MCLKFYRHGAQNCADPAIAFEEVESSEGDLEFEKLGWQGRSALSVLGP